MFRELMLTEYVRVDGCCCWLKMAKWLWSPSSVHLLAFYWHSTATSPVLVLPLAFLCLFSPNPKASLAEILILIPNRSQRFWFSILSRQRTTNCCETSTETEKWQHESTTAAVKEAASRLLKGTGTSSLPPVLPSSLESMNSWTQKVR